MYRVLASVLLLTVVLHASYSTAPPVWPQRFSSNLTETIRLFNRIKVVQNRGAWYYDFANRRMRFDHLDGQLDPLCVTQGLSPHPTAACHQIFSNDSNLYVHYPEAKACCLACNSTQGCSVLIPDWLKGAQDAGTKQVGSRTCRGWKLKGAFAEDYWYITQDGRPCQYYETYSVIGIPLLDKSLTFDPNTYSVAPIPDAIFAVPDYCHRPCRVSYAAARSKRWYYGRGFTANGM